MGLLFSRHILGMLSMFFKPFTLICIKASEVLTFVDSVVAVTRCIHKPDEHRFCFCFRHSGPIAVGLLLSLLSRL